MGLHIVWVGGYPLQGVVVVDVGVLLVYWVLQAVGVLLGLGVGPALVLVVPLYSVLCVLLPGVGVKLPASIVRKVSITDISLSYVLLSWRVYTVYVVTAGSVKDFPASRIKGCSHRAKKFSQEKILPYTNGFNNLFIYVTL